MRRTNGMMRQERAFNIARVMLSVWLLLAITAPCVLAQQAPPAGTPAVGVETPAAGAPAAAPPAPPPKIDSGDTAWVLVSTALVLAMTAPGLALFSGGRVREKTAWATTMQSSIILCVISVQWVLWGYTLAFARDPGTISVGR